MNSKWEMPRTGFGEGLLEVAALDERVVVLCADLTESIKIAAFAKAYPDRFIEVGVAEQNMMGIAAGLALEGKIPFVASYAAFNPGRNWDQLRVSVAYSQANVKIIGAHAGVSVGPDGATHQALEDIALTRVIPGLSVVVPTDREETRKAVHALVKHKGPVYMRFGRDTVASITQPADNFSLGAAYRLRIGKDITIFANGALVHEALLAADILAKEGIELEVVAVPTVKPLDSETILTSARKTRHVIAAEEAQVAGGLGGAIAELLGEHFPVPLKRIGILDTFGQSGTKDELMDFYGLRSTGILKAARQLLKK